MDNSGMKNVQYLIDEDGDPIIREQVGERLRYEIWLFTDDECIVESYLREKPDDWIIEWKADWTPDMDFPSWLIVA